MSSTELQIFYTMLEDVDGHAIQIRTIIDRNINRNMHSSDGVTKLQVQKMEIRIPFEFPTNPEIGNADYSFITKNLQEINYILREKLHAKEELTLEEFAGCIIYRLVLGMNR